MATTRERMCITDDFIGAMPQHQNPAIGAVIYNKHILIWLKGLQTALRLLKCSQQHYLLLAAFFNDTCRDDLIKSYEYSLLICDS